MRSRRHTEETLFVCASLAIVVAVAAAFYAPALARTRGVWPAPLDDVYIHFGFARSAALGHPFEWIPGNGYSSGGTSLTYPLVLAPGWLLGFRGARLGVFAALVACLALVDLCRSLRRLALSAGAPRLAAWAAPPLVLALPLLDWSWFSGMETALLGAVLGRALSAVDRAARASSGARARAQLAAGIWTALLFATRPEMLALSLPLGVAVAHAAGALPLGASLARSLGPLALVGAGQALANRALTSEIGAAGAVRKLLWSSPYPTPIEIAGEVVKNLVALRSQAIETALGGHAWAWVVPVLGLAAALDRRTRRLGVPLLAGAAGALLLVALNATARFQNWRYAAPSLAMLLAAAALGVAALACRGRAGGLVAGLLVAAAVAAPARGFSRQIDHFARASANIAGQQVEIARRLEARTPRPRRVLVNDAGAIPYLSGIPAIDGLGLGGYRGLPFARASVHGVPAVVELIERLDPDERPDAFALYPSWWIGLADLFGRRVDAVHIDDNVICAADEKVIYLADWSTLAPPNERRAGVIDAIDVADVVDERAHAYALPSPRGGWVIGAVLADGAFDGPAAAAGAPRRFDAGRIVPEGREESFELRAPVAPGPATLVLRTDGGGPVELSVSIERAGVRGREQRASAPGRATGAWIDLEVLLDEVVAGDRVHVAAVRGAWRSFHAWIVPAARADAVRPSGP